MMKQVIFLGIVLSMFVGCTKYNQIDTGICKAEFPGNMYEYFQSDSYNWDSLLVMIDYTGLEKYFTGEEPGYEEITFFGPTNHSIRRWLYSLRTNMNDMGLPDSTKVKIMLQDKETCRDLILSHIIKGKRLAADFKEGTANDETSGEMVTGANGKQFMTAQIEYEEYTEEELRPFFERAFEEEILPPVDHGKSFILDNIGKLYSLTMHKEEVIQKLKS